MSETFKSIVKSQYHAALTTLYNAISECPLEVWAGKVANHSFNQSAFHAIFYGDVYLGANVDVLKEQVFHQRYADTFGDYEEFKRDHVPVNEYTKEFVLAYLEHCRAKVNEVLDKETDEDLAADADFFWLEISRAELHIYNIRHIQHHAAQLILRLRLDSDVNIGWVRNG